MTTENAMERRAVSKLTVSEKLMTTFYWCSSVTFFENDTVLELLAFVYGPISIGRRRRLAVCGHIFIMVRFINLTIIVIIIFMFR